MTKPFNPIITLEEINYLAKLFSACELRRNDYTINQPAADYCLAGLAPNPELAKEFEEKLKIPEKEIPSDEGSRYPYTSDIYTIRQRIEGGSFFLSEYTIEDINHVLYLIGKYNCHEAIKDIVAVFSHGIPGNEYNAHHYQKRVNRTLFR